MKILLTLSYVGTGFSGFQVQNNAPTVQGALNAAAEELLGFSCDITGCSRTDSGVHARQFCATLAPASQPEPGEHWCSVPLQRLPRALNMHLPDDIAVSAAAAVPDTFHARYHVQSKEYVYRIDNGRERNPFLRTLAYHYPYPIDAAALEAMRRGASAMVGRHDFRAFMAAGSKVRETVRTVHAFTVCREGEEILLTVSADGFLYHMVRIMAGTLLEIAAGRLTAEDIPKILDDGDRSRAGFTAPPQGLYLNRVIYPRTDSEATLVPTS